MEHEVLSPASDDAFDPAGLADLEAEYELLGELGRGG